MSHCRHFRHGDVIGQSYNGMQCFIIVARVEDVSFSELIDCYSADTHGRIVARSSADLNLVRTKFEIIVHYPFVKLLINMEKVVTVEVAIKQMSLRRKYSYMNATRTWRAPVDELLSITNCPTAFK